MKRKNSFWILIILTVLIFVIILIGRRYFFYESILSSSMSMEDEISQIVIKMDDNGQFSGAVLIAVKGDIIYKNAVGYANLEDSTPNTLNTKFRIASFTKPFTVMLILQLVEDGKLELDGKLINYLPEFPKEKGENITIHQL